MKRILVTGASGFIGKHAIHPLVQRGYEVHALSRTQGDAGVPKAYICDLFDHDAVRALLDRVRPTHLLHLAWSVPPGKLWTAPENLECVAASLNLYRTFVNSGGKRFVGAGTCAEYDWTQDGTLVEGITPCAPATLYGIAKDSLRRMIAASSGADGVSFCWGRIFFVYGPGEKPGRLTSDIIRNLLTGQTVETSHGRQVRDFMHVADVARAFAALCDSDLEGAVNIASGQACELKQIISRIGDIAGRPDLLRIGARPARENEPARLAASVEGLRDIGYAPTFDLDRGLADTVNWWRRELGVRAE